MTDLATTGYTVDDLDWLRDEIGVAHLELDPWGSLIVSPATDEHEIAQGGITVQAARQLDPARYSVLPSIPWTVPGGSGYLMIPDLTVLAAGCGATVRCTSIRLPCSWSRSPRHPPATSTGAGSWRPTGSAAPTGT